MILIKWLWNAIGIFVAIQYFYWATMQAGFMLGVTDAPHPDNVWLFFSFSGAGFFAGDRVFERFKNVSPRK